MYRVSIPPPPMHRQSGVLLVLVLLDKQEDFRQPPTHARLTRVHSRTRQFGECHHMHNNSLSITHAPLMTFHQIIQWEIPWTVQNHQTPLEGPQHTYRLPPSRIETSDAKFAISNQGVVQYRIVRLPVSNERRYR